MRYRMLTPLVAVLLAIGCGPSEPVQEGMEGAGAKTPAAKPATPETSQEGRLLEPQPKAPEAKPSEPAENQPPLVEPEAKPAEPEAQSAEPKAKPTEPEAQPAQPEAKPTEPESTPQKEPQAAISQPAEQPEGATGDKTEEPKDPLVLAIEAVQGGDFGAAKSHLDSVLKDDPTNQNALYLLTVTQLSEAVQHERFGEMDKANPLYLESNATLEKLQKAHPNLALPPQLLSRVRFETSRTHARAGKTDEAIAMLQSAIDAGWDDLDRLTEDADLQSVRQRPEFKTIVDNLSQKLVAQAESQAKELLATHEPFDFDFSLSNIDGQPVSLADYKGKVLIVDFWGTWCGWCVKEIPHLLELREKHGKKGLEIVGIAYEHPPEGKTAEDLVREFVQEHNLTYACVIGDDATQSKVPDFGGFPTTLFIDRKGKVRAKVVGYRPYRDLEAIVTLLLNEETAEADGLPQSAVGAGG